MSKERKQQIKDRADEAIIEIRRIRADALLGYKVSDQAFYQLQETIDSLKHHIRMAEVEERGSKSRKERTMVTKKKQPKRPWQTRDCYPSGRVAEFVATAETEILCSIEELVEYVSESEHQDGWEWITLFDTLDDAIEDFKEYLKHAREDGDKSPG